MRCVFYFLWFTNARELQDSGFRQCKDYGDEVDWVVRCARRAGKKEDADLWV